MASNKILKNQHFDVSSDTTSSTPVSSDTNSIVSRDCMMISHESTTTSPLAVGLLNSFGVPSFSPWHIDSISKEMQLFYPSKKIQHRDIAVNYFEQVKKSVISGILRARQAQLDDNIIPISWNQLRRSCARYGSKGKQQYWFDWFQEHHPLLIKIKEGYKFGKQGTLTMVKTTLDVQVLLASQDPKTVFEAYYGALDPNLDIDLCPVDQISLHNYINANKAIIKRTRTLDENLKIARTILLISQAPQCQGYLPQIISESQFGRKYYKGINLQTAPKIVRQAALGECHQYDIEASVFTWKLDLCKEMYEDKIKLPATIDYLEYKNHHRRRLAELVFETNEDGYVSYIKQAITAIGFGARKTNAVWMSENGTWKTTALRNIIRSESHLNKFLNDSWVKEFMQEQDTMNQIIWEEIKETDLIKNDLDLRNKNNQISKARAIAKAYQITERKMLSALTKVAKDNSVLLMCHDGFYTKDKAKLAELKECLKQFMPSGNLEHTFFTRYFFQDPSELQNHYHHINQEELAAREWAMNNGLEYYAGNNEFKKLKKKYSHPSPSEFGTDFDNGYRDDISSMKDYDPEQDEYWNELSAEEQEAILILKDNL